MNHDVYSGPYDAKYMARNRVRGWNEVSFTMQAQARNAPQHPQAPKMTFVSSVQRVFAKGFEHLYRRLSVRECARIQTFPDSFHFLYSDVKDGYKMVGNAVPPRLAWFLAVQVKKTFADLMTISNEEKRQTSQSVKRVQVCQIAEKYPIQIINHSGMKLQNGINGLELDKRVLIGLVKSDNIENYIDKSAKIYYTGKKFPSTVHLNKLYYFMPYIKGKGIRDLYFIKVARIGSKMEVHPECADNDFRIVLEIEYISSLFDGYRPIHLNIWQTFTDTKLDILLRIDETEE